MGEQGSGSPDSSDPIEHLDWQPGEPELQDESGGVMGLAQAVGIMERISKGEDKATILSDYGGWEELELQLGSKNMFKLFGNREEIE